MALSTKLMLRQGQSLVMTPQLLQAIKLLQLSNLELVAFVEEELERNPLLERADDREAAAEAAEPREPPAAENDGQDWTSQDIPVDRAALERDLGTELENAFESDRPVTPSERQEMPELGLSATAWSGTAAQGGDGEAPNLEAYVAASLSLHDVLEEQLAIALTDPTDRLIGRSIIDLIDDAGYLTEGLGELAERLGISIERAERVLATIQGFDPTGVGARDLAECLSIQLREADRLDPAMQILIANLPLLARRDFAQLRKLCGVDEEDLADMVAEIRRLDPKPGRAYGGSVIEPALPDVYVRPAADGSWHIELNSDVLPRVLVNQTYYARIAKGAGRDGDKSFVANCLQTANWLTKSLEQRARTILKVASEIVRHQDAFFAEGVEHLRPLNLKTIADAIGMHESTVSRVTSNKYMATPRGLFEMKYFFTASIASSAGGEAHSAEAVRFRIKQMIEAESPQEILSDDAIVVKLKQMDVDIARRTVAKYRESLRIPSSVERRREKQAARHAN
jgi:RNA polymerase sigma-54 factor